MSTSKLVKSTRNIEEHIDNLVAVQEAKAKGKADSVICKELQISHTTLQKYKAILVEQSLKTLTPEYQDAKRCELDEQIQTIIRKIFSVVNTVDDQYDIIRREVEDALNDPELEPENRLRLRRAARYPVEDIVELKKILISAVELRSKVWGLDKENNQKVQINNNRKLIFQVNHQLEDKTGKLDQLANSIISGISE